MIEVPTTSLRHGDEASLPGAIREMYPIGEVRARATLAVELQDCVAIHPSEALRHKSRIHSIVVILSNFAAVYVDPKRIRTRRDEHHSARFVPKEEIVWVQNGSRSISRPCDTERRVGSITKQLDSDVIVVFSIVADKNCFRSANRIAVEFQNSCGIGSAQRADAHHLARGDGASPEHELDGRTL